MNIASPGDKPLKILTAPCKINIFLRLLSRRQDGYHELESLFFPLEAPCDILTVTAIKTQGMDFSCSEPGLATKANILVKTYAAFADRTGYSPSLHVHLEKIIPYGAGLGGGSSDAAAFLLFLNDEARKYAGLDLDRTELAAMASSLGADVPFFLHKQPALVSGIGEKVKAVPNPFSGLHLLLVCPKIHVSTAWAFTAWDEKKLQKAELAPLTNKARKDTTRSVRGICIQNDLEPAVFARHPELEKIKLQLYEHGAIAASMSGSGSSMFGLFSSGDSAQNALHFFLDSGERVFYHFL